MGRLIYSTIASLDGFVADTTGNFDWAAPDEQVHAAVNDLERGHGTYLYGRRMYEVMRFWEDANRREASSAATLDFAGIWQAADKVVYSTTNPRITTARTRLEPSFDPDVVRQLVAQSPTDVSIGGPTLAARALHAGLVDAVNLFLVPTVVGGGIPVWPAGLDLKLSLLDVTRYDGGMTHLAYERLG